MKSRSLWTAGPSKARWLDQVVVRPITEAEVEKIRARVDAEADASPFACTCLACKLRRARRS